MLILNLCSKHPADDKRVYDKITMALKSREFTVINTAPNAADHVTSDGIRIMGFRQKPGFMNRILSLKALKKIIVREMPDVVIAHEPDSIVAAYSVYKRDKKSFGLIFDCHEAYEYYYNTVMRNRVIASFLNHYTMRILNYVIKRIDAVLSVNNTMTERYRKYNSRSYMIPSVPASDILKTNRTTQRDKSRVAFFGQFGGGNQIKVLLHAARILKKQETSISIVVIGGYGGYVGNQDKNEQALIKTISDEGLSNVIDYRGWMQRTEAFSLLRQCVAGIMRFDSDTMPGNYAMPNKLFEYMGCELAVIACKRNIEIAHIVEEEDCGYLMEQEDGEELAAILTQIGKKPEEAEQKGANGLHAVLSKYNWSHYGKVLEEIILDIRR